MTNLAESILEFEEVAIEGGHPYDTAIWGVTFRLAAGQLMIVHLERGHLRIPLADAAQGLAEPIQGHVRFLRRDWRDLRQEDLFAARARIGRVFDEPGWLTELDMDDNITLAQRHHTRRSEAAIRDEASELARNFSLPGLPQGRSSGVRLSDLRRSACVRAFIGEPALLVLENPTSGVYPDIMPALMDRIRAVRSRGAAVLWTTSNWEVWNDPGIRPTFRSTMSGSQMRTTAGA
jgi:phospholipid/cholesterol/gamma-HCH transport system ATP-binding protein